MGCLGVQSPLERWRSVLDGCKEESEEGRRRRRDDESHSSLAAFLAPSLTVEEVKGKGLGLEEPRGGTQGSLEYRAQEEGLQESL